MSRTVFIGKTSNFVAGKHVVSADHLPFVIRWNRDLRFVPQRSAGSGTAFDRAGSQRTMFQRRARYSTPSGRSIVFAVDQVTRHQSIS